MQIIKCFINNFYFKREMSKNLLMLLFLTIFIPCTVTANTCTNEDYNLLKEKASKIEFNFEYKIVEFDDYLSDNELLALYDIIAYNVVDDFQIQIQYVNEDDYVWYFEKGSNNTMSLQEFNSGKMKITIKSKSSKCSNKTIKTEYMVLPYYNNYYDSDTCKKYPSFKYCKERFIETYINNVTFNNELNDYLENISKEEIDDEVLENNDHNYFKMVSFILVFIIVIILLIYMFYKITMKIYKRRKL